MLNFCPAVGSGEYKTDSRPNAVLYGCSHCGVEVLGGASNETAMTAKGVSLVALICCFLLTAHGQLPATEDAAAVPLASSPASVSDSAVTAEHVTQAFPVVLQAAETGTVASSAASEPPVPISSHPPRLFPLVSPLVAVAPDLGAMSAGLGPVTPGSFKGVFLPRHLYGSARQAAAAAARAGAVPAVPAAAAAAAVAAEAGPKTQAGKQKPSCSGAPVGGCGVGITYHSPNPVMRTLKFVPMFYGTWTEAQKTMVTTFLSGLGGSSWMGINNLYSDTTGYIAGTAGLYTGQSYTFPTTSSDTTLSDAQVVTLVQQGISALTNAAVGSGGLTDTLYMLLTGPDITQASSSTQTFCASYCGWHWYYTQNSDRVTVKYMWIGNAITQCPGACISSALTATNSPSGDKGIDGMLSVLAHEITEAASDPLGTTWFRTSGTSTMENADICAWQFGPTYTNAAGKVYNVRDIKGNYYLLQKNLNPNTGNCVTGV